MSRRRRTPWPGFEATATPERLSVLAPTRLEAWAVRWRAPQLDVMHCETRLLRRPPPGPTVICGLAGGLAADLPTGSLLIPDAVGLPDGRRFACEPNLVGHLRAGARRLGLSFHTDPIVSLPHLVTGDERGRWRAEGYLAADMEAGPLLAAAVPVACVRVVLDSPEREVSPLWLTPSRAARRPSLWPQLLWLAVHAPALALRAAAVTAAAFPPPLTRHGNEERRAG